MTHSSNASPGMRQRLERQIDQALGRVPADLVIRNARILDLVTGGLEPGDIAICDDIIVGIYESYRGTQEMDAKGRIAVPGFIDSHVHCESTLVTPGEFDRCVLPHGTTTAVCDPHEICNVLGEAGLQYFLDSALGTAMDLRVQLSSCVPATMLETSGARLSAADLVRYRHHSKVIGLAEFMNVPGVLSKDPECLDKLAAFAEQHIDGHAPLLSGRSLNAYLACGVKLPRDHQSGRGAGKALEGHAIADPRRHGLQRSGCARTFDRCFHLALHRLLHRRPQSVGYSRGRSPGSLGPARDRHGRPTCCRLSGGELVSRPRVRVARPRPAGARLYRRSFATR